MAKAKCLVNVTFGATGDTYQKGCEYDVPAATLKKYPEYFDVVKKASDPDNKQAATEENK